MIIPSIDLVGGRTVQLIGGESQAIDAGDAAPILDRLAVAGDVAVIDIDAVYERLTAAGMSFHCPPQPVGGGTRATYGRDPDGNVVEIQELQPADSPLAIRVD